ncbi:hypothetical protein SAMN05880561_105213 [Rhizobium sp. RU33A]|uniref:hypothetical protein n=1 Tax=Rhizobium sp. RU33A TaxID=1907413 RepID=UPI000956BC3B|nr:hypothetical protein [Rhizobium sp. RU33A]SIQ88006.1 hypothetical protein SAMN05880561_105213 [Rhizobium sp. RU33A]
MKNTQALIPTSLPALVPSLLVIGFSLASCQLQSGEPMLTGQNAVLSTLENPAVAQPIATDLTEDLAGLIPKTAKLVFDQDMPPVMRAALRQTLSTKGYRVGSADDRQGKDILLKLKVFEVGEDLLLRVTTPAIRLSKVYRMKAAGSAQIGDVADDAGGASTMRAIHVAGPPVLETIGGANGP